MKSATLFLMSRRARSFGLAAGANLVALILLAPSLGAVADTLPASIPDREFWSLTEQLSEPNGSFQSDNLLSNEMALSAVAAALPERVKPGSVYLGVGPEQNFTYIAAMRPRMAFITDIRRGNLHMHLMYKALFELSADRAEFVSRLFTKPRPEGLTAQSSAADLMNAFWDVNTSTETTYQANLQAIKDVLMKKHGFPLSTADIDGIEYVYHSFYWYGPRITYSSSTSGVTARGVTYAALDPATSKEHSYLSSEEKFTFLKTLQSNNLVVPIVGDFAGPKALRAVGKYVRDHNASVGAFYVSNVESYLQRNGVWQNFCGNVATMPLDDTSVFIRPGLGGGTGTFTITSVNGTTGNTNVTFVARSGTATLNGASALELQRLLTAGNLTTISPRLTASTFGAMASEVAPCAVR